MIETSEMRQNGHASFGQVIGRDVGKELLLIKKKAAEELRAIEHGAVVLKDKAKDEFRVIGRHAKDALHKVGDAVKRTGGGNGAGIGIVESVEVASGKAATVKKTAKAKKEAKAAVIPSRKLGKKGASLPKNKGNPDASYDPIKGPFLDPTVVPRDTRRFFRSIRDEKYETIEHPGNPSESMEVPKFFSPDPKVHRWHPTDDLLTRKEADSMFGHKSPWGDPTVYVAIASYRDWQCRYTVESIFGRAKFPERIRVAVVDQIAKGDDKCSAPIKPCFEDQEQALCKYSDRIDVFQMDAKLAVGPVFARHLGHRMYRGEYFAMQVDAHVTFVQGWDQDIIGQWTAAGNEMAVLSTYLTDVQGSIDENGHSLRNTRPIMCNTDFEGGKNKYLRHKSQPEGFPGILGSPQLEPYWAAGFSFSRGHFVTVVPYDQHLPMIFQGEEISITVRGWTQGYDFYAFERSVVFHMYATGANAEKRHKVKLFWENGSIYGKTEQPAMKRLLGIIGLKPELKEDEYSIKDLDLYGLGTHRKPSQFYKLIGIDVQKKVTEQHLCNFVTSGQMHHMFTPKIRKDGMGIDYEGIDYHFVDRH